jgi:alpha-galactosidase
LRTARVKVLVVALLGLAALCAVQVGPQHVNTVDRALAVTPPMGWSSYNSYGRHATAADLEQQATALVTSGMKAAGYTYVNLDGGWDLPTRDAFGRLQPDPRKFPDGIAPVARYVHSLGLKFGIYTGLGTANCAHTGAGSWGHYRQDVRTFASWGVDFVKVDWCAVPRRRFPGMTDAQIAARLYSQFGSALRAAGRPMAYSLSTNHPSLAPWSWAPRVGNMWRTSGDMHDTFAFMRSHFLANVGRYASAGPGTWNDPDMLEVGNGGMTRAEDRANVSLWAEMAAPLIAGNDLTTMSAATRKILANRQVIAVDQDPLGRQGRVVARRAGHWVLSKPLTNGACAVVLFNATDRRALIATSTTRVGLQPGGTYLVNNLWTHRATQTSGRFGARVAPHAAVMFRVGGRTPDHFIGLGAAAGS